MTETEPEAVVGVSHGDASGRDAGADGRLDKAEVTEQFISGRKGQRIHGTAWGKWVLKWDKRAALERSHRRERVSAITLSGPGM